ncbi:hypothetical protein BB561_005927 [Smittium simulii]|uniref:WD40 repeat-like protein n=1 Tax=Smittium simulii TaxID=133385 RepID=A0A2T9Y7L8_9FUNG|nr:hypothetical protein BB561_005927 [Smittium simulii]
MAHSSLSNCSPPVERQSITPLTEKCSNNTIIQDPPTLETSSPALPKYLSLLNFPQKSIQERESLFENVFAGTKTVFSELIQGLYTQNSIKSDSPIIQPSINSDSPQIQLSIKSNSPQIQLSIKSNSLQIKSSEKIKRCASLGSRVLSLSEKSSTYSSSSSIDFSCQQKSSQQTISKKQFYSNIIPSSFFKKLMNYKNSIINIPTMNNFDSKVNDNDILSASSSKEPIGSVPDYSSTSDISTSKSSHLRTNSATNIFLAPNDSEVPSCLKPHSDPSLDNFQTNQEHSTSKLSLHSTQDLNHNLNNASNSDIISKSTDYFTSSVNTVPQSISNNSNFKNKTKLKLKILGNPKSIFATNGIPGNNPEINADSNNYTNLKSAVSTEFNKSVSSHSKSDLFFNVKRKGNPKKALYGIFVAQKISTDSINQKIIPLPLNNDFKTSNSKNIAIPTALIAPSSVSNSYTKDKTLTLPVKNYRLSRLNTLFKKSHSSSTADKADTISEPTTIDITSRSFFTNTSQHHYDHKNINLSKNTSIGNHLQTEDPSYIAHMPIKTSVTASLASEPSFAIWCMGFSIDGKYLAAGGQNGILYIYKLKDFYNQSSSFPSFNSSKNDHLKYPPSPNPLNFPPKKISCSSKSTHTNSHGLITPSFNQDTSIFGSNPYRMYAGHQRDILSISWSKNGFILSSSLDKTVRLWHPDRTECLRTFAHSDTVTCVSFHPIDDRFFISGSLDRYIRLWDIPKKEIKLSTMLPDKDLITAISFGSSQGCVIIAGTYSGCLVFYRSNDLSVIETIYNFDKKNQKNKGKKITGIVYYSIDSKPLSNSHFKNDVSVFDDLYINNAEKGSEYEALDGLHDTSTKKESNQNEDKSINHNVNDNDILSASSSKEPIGSVPDYSSTSDISISKSSHLRTNSATNIFLAPNDSEVPSCLKPHSDPSLDNFQTNQEHSTSKLSLHSTQDLNHNLNNASNSDIISKSTDYFTSSVNTVPQSISNNSNFKNKTKLKLKILGNPKSIFATNGIPGNNPEINADSNNYTNLKSAVSTEFNKSVSSHSKSDLFFNVKRKGNPKKALYGIFVAQKISTDSISQKIIPLPLNNDFKISNSKNIAIPTALNAPSSVSNSYTKDKTLTLPVKNYRLSRLNTLFKKSHSSSAADKADIISKPTIIDITSRSFFTNTSQHHYDHKNINLSKNTSIGNHLQTEDPSYIAHMPIKTSVTASLASELSFAIWCMGFSIDGKYLAAGGQNGILYIYKLKDFYNQSSSFPSFNSSKNDHLKYPPSPNPLNFPPKKISCSSKSTHTHSQGLINPSLNQDTSIFGSNPYRMYAGHQRDILSISWSKNGFILSSSLDKTVRLWHPDRTECLRTFAHSDTVTCVSFHPIDDRFFISGSLDRYIRLWDIPKKEIKLSTMLPDKDLITAISFGSSQGCVIIAGTYSGCLVFYRSNDLSVIETIYNFDKKNQKNKGKKITGIVYYSIDSKPLSNSHFKNDVSVFDDLYINNAEKGSEYEALDGLHDASTKKESNQNEDKSINQNVSNLDFNHIKQNSFNPNTLLKVKSYIVVSSNDSTIRIYNAQSRKLTQKLKGHTCGHSQVFGQPSFDGKYVISGSEDKDIYLWSLSPENDVVLAQSDSKSSELTQNIYIKTKKTLKKQINKLNFQLSKKPTSQKAKTNSVPDIQTEFKINTSYEHFQAHNNPPHNSTPTM